MKTPSETMPALNDAPPSGSVTRRGALQAALAAGAALMLAPALVGAQTAPNKADPNPSDSATADEPAARPKRRERQMKKKRALLTKRESAVKTRKKMNERNAKAARPPRAESKIKNKAK